MIAVVVPEIYVPAPCTLPPLDGLELTDNVYVGVKFAVMFLFPFIVTVTGLDEPLTSPLQFENTYPLAGFAVSVAELP